MCIIPKKRDFTVVMFQKACSPVQRLNEIYYRRTHFNMTQVKGHMLCDINPDMFDQDNK